MNSKKPFFFYFIIIISFSIAGFGLSQLAPFDIETGEVYIRGNDVIKNFKLDTFDGIEIDSAGNPIGNTRIKFEEGPFWTADQDDITIDNIYVVGNEIYFGYRIDFHNKINIFTNVLLTEASPKFEEVEEEFEVAKYTHKGTTGDVIYGPYYNYIKWNHYDFGEDLQPYNAKYNTFKGPLVCSFDIAQNPLPAFLHADVINDTQQIELSKQFDYVGIDAVYTSNAIHGMLSNDMPEIQGFVPQEYQQTENEYYEEDFSVDSHGISITWDPNVHFVGDPIKTTVVDFGIVPPTPGSSLHPTQKNGAAIWNAEDERSMSSCKFTYGLTRLSPIIYEYSMRLGYNWQNRVTRDELEYVFPLGFKIKTRIAYSKDETYTETRPVGLHVVNRYVQATINVRFSIWTKYKLDSISEGIDLGIPEEYYDELIWTTVVDGLGGAETFRSGFEFNLLGSMFGNIMLIVGIIVGIIFLYIVYKIIKNRNAGRPIFYGINPLKK